MKEWIHFDVDFSECKNWYDLHEELKHKLDFPDYYGRNLDALWDCITGHMYTPAYVAIHGMNSLPKSISATAERILEVFRHAEVMYGNIRVRVEE